jgi:hypothetical protein
MKTLSLHTMLALYAIAFCIVASPHLYSQTMPTADTSVRSASSRFSAEGAMGFVLFNERTPVSGYSRTDFVERTLRSAQGSFEVGVRFPINNSPASLYLGVQGSLYSWGQAQGEFKGNPVVIFTNSGTWERVYLMTELMGRWNVNAGLETDLGWLQSRSTVGIGALYSRIHFLPPSPSNSSYVVINESNFAFVIRQNLTRDIGMFYIGGQFEQTFSYLDTFSSFSLIAGIRW